MSRSSTGIFECGSCKVKFYGPATQNIEGGEVLCSDCAIRKRKPEEVSGYPAPSEFVCMKSKLFKMQVPAQVVEKSEDQMDLEVGDSEYYQTPKTIPGPSDDDMTNRLREIMNRMFTFEAPGPQPAASCSSEASKREGKVIFRKFCYRSGNNFSQRARSSFTCPKCFRYKKRSSSSDNLDPLLLSKMDSLRVTNPDNDKKVDQDVGPVQDAMQDHVDVVPSASGDTGSTNEGGSANPEQMESVTPSDLNTPPTPRKVCGHRDGTFMARCHICMKKFDLASPTSSPFGCLVCYFRKKITNRRRRGPFSFIL